MHIFYAWMHTHTHVCVGWGERDKSIFLKFTWWTFYLRYTHTHTLSLINASYFMLPTCSGSFMAVLTFVGVQLLKTRKHDLSLSQSLHLSTPHHFALFTTVLFFDSWRNINEQWCGFPTHISHEASWRVHLQKRVATHYRHFVYV